MSDTWFGNRVLAVDHQAHIVGHDPVTGQALYDGAPVSYVATQGLTTEHYTYDAMNRLTGVERDGVQTDVRLYDAASRVVQTGPASALPQAYAAALDA